MSSRLSVDVSQGIATLTFTRPASLNAFGPADYDDFAKALRDVDKRDDVLVTLLQATGRWFCAGADVKLRNSDRGLPDGGAADSESDSSLREQFAKRVFPSTFDCSKALYEHSKILIAALNGPVMGIMAALLGQFDFIYAMPNMWLSCPFSFLGIVAEGGASVSFVNRMGIAKANEVLIWGKRKNADELLGCGFLNQIFPQQSTEEFHSTIRSHVLDEIEGLVPTSILTVKRLIKAGVHEKNNPDAVNMRESYAQAERFVSGIPTVRFGMIARKEIKHKL